MSLGQGKSARYESIDLVRGAALLTMLLVSSRSPVAQLRHGSWYGPTLADLVYPCFLFVSGLSLAVSARRTERGNLAKRLVRRLLLLYVIGTLLTFLGSGRIGLGTLQSIAIASALALPAMFLPWPRQPIYLAACIIAQLCIYLPLGEPHAVWTEMGSAAGRVDVALLGKFRGVEGVLGSLFSGLFVITGLIYGRIFTRESADRLLGGTLFASAYLVLGLIFVRFFPIVARLVSPSFLFLAGASLLALSSLTVWLLEGRSVGSVLRRVVHVGENPLAIFCGVKLFQDLLLRANVGTPPIQIAELLRTHVQTLVGASLGNATVPLIKLLVAVTIAEALRKRRIRLRL